MSPTKTPSPLFFWYSWDRDNFTQSPKDMYRSIYFNALDNAIQAVKFRFEQTEWIVFKNIQELFLYSLRGEEFEETLGEVLQLYLKMTFRGTS